MKSINNFIKNNIILSGATEIKGDVKILITVLSVIVFAGVCALLVWLVLKERRRYSVQKITEGKMTPEKFDSALEFKLKNASEKTHFMVFKILILNSQDLIAAFGEEQYLYSLTRLADALKRIFKLTSNVCIYSKEELEVIASDIFGMKIAEEYCAQIISTMTKPMTLVDGIKLEFEVNVGAVAYDGTNKSAAVMKKNLELAAINAQRNGPNTYVVFSMALAIEGTDEVRYYHEVKEAITNGEFALYFQPIYDLDQSRISAYEALLRWNHRTLGVLEPSKFLHILEQSGDIVWVGTWELNALYAKYTAMKKINPQFSLMFGMNLSAKQLTNPRLFDDVRNVAKKYSLPAEDFCFEIMDINLYAAVPSVKENIDKLADAGYKIMIDNYGLDLNSMKVFESGKIFGVKLDRAFVRDMKDSPLHQGVVKMLDTYSQGGRLQIIANGIEDIETLDTVKKAGVHFGQGYLFGKPRSINEI